MMIVRFFQIVLFMCWIPLLHASLDPVSWQLQPQSGFGAIPVGQQSVVSYTLTNHLPFPVTLSTNYFHQGGSFSGQDNCRGVMLLAGQSCNIYIAVRPTAVGTSKVQLMYSYHHNQIPLPPLVAEGTSQGGGGGGGGEGFIQGTFSNLPPVITLNPLTEPRFTITYQNTGSAAVTGYAGDNGGTNLLSVSPGGLSTVTLLTNTCGTFGSPKTLQPLEICTVTGKLTPTSPGLVTVSGLFTYNSGASTATPSSKTFIINGSGSCVVSTSTPLPLAQKIYRYFDNVVQFQFTNDCATSVSLGSVAVSAQFTPNNNENALVTVGNDGCSNQTLASGTSCTVLVSAIPNDVATSFSLTASVSAGGQTAFATTSASLFDTDSSKHHVYFVNQCPFTVWYGIANGTGAWQKDPNTGNWELTGTSVDPTPGSQTGGAPLSSYQLSTQISGLAPTFIDLPVSRYINGAIWPRTGCAFSGGDFQCTTGYCATLSNSGTCVKADQPFGEPVPPNTKFEFTINSTAGTDGVYDVSVINGFNTPVEIKGLGPFVSTGPSSADPFTCTGAGAPIQPTSVSTGLAICSWQFDPTTGASGASGLTVADVAWVVDGAEDGCASDGDCAAGLTCGMSFTSFPVNTPITRHCGKFLGYWTLADYVGYSSAAQWGTTNLYNTFNMGLPMTSISSKNYGNLPDPCGGSAEPACNAATFTALLACTPTTTNAANTCYNSASDLTTCCGCVDWSFTATSKSCLGQNPDWLNTQSTGITVYNAVYWLKQACPTAYAYQFDDPSSSFGCYKDAAGEPMLTSYQITFCPGGQTGLPAGITDGRADTP